MHNTLYTGPLQLRPPHAELAEEVRDFYLRNRAFLAPFEPRREEVFFMPPHCRQALKKEVARAKAKEAFQFYLFEGEKPDRMIGMVALNNIVWGDFCSCFLGYKMDEAHTGKGFMTRAVSCVCQWAFSELGLHRIEANVMPRNKASMAVLQKCGFENEGLARKYLRINGVWEDHIHMTKLNEDM